MSATKLSLPNTPVETLKPSTPPASYSAMYTPTNKNKNKTNNTENGSR